LRGNWKIQRYLFSIKYIYGLINEIWEQNQGAYNYRAWKTCMGVILAKNKALNFVFGKFKEPLDDARKEGYNETSIISMNLIH